MGVRVTSLGFALAGALTVGSGCGLFFGDVGPSGGGGTGEGGTLATTSKGTGTGGKDDGSGGGGGGPPMECPAGLDSLGGDSWILTISSAMITDVEVAGQYIVAVGTATPDVPCGVPFDNSGLMGDRLFLIVVESDNGHVQRVVDLGPAEGNEVRLSHGNSQGNPLVAWTRPNGLCVMPVSDATPDCPAADATLRCELQSGSFSNIGVAATSEPVALFLKPQGNGTCVAGGSANIELVTPKSHLLLNASDGELTTIGAPAGIRMGIAQSGPGRVRITGICAEDEPVMGASCTDPNATGSHHMFTMALDVDGPDLAMPDFFSPIATIVTPQFGFVAPSAVGVAYSAQQTAGDARRAGWGGETLAPSPLTQLKFEGSGDLEFPTGIRSADVADDQGQIVTGVALTSALTLFNKMPLFDCGAAECTPYSYWIRTPPAPDAGTQPYQVAVITNDQSGTSCSRSAVAVERGLLVGLSAVLGGLYTCGRPVVGETSYGLPTERDEANAFLARLAPVTAP